VTTKKKMFCITRVTPVILGLRCVASLPTGLGVSVIDFITTAGKRRCKFMPNGRARIQASKKIVRLAVPQADF
jgi:hypothetical protein